MCEASTGLLTSKEGKTGRVVSLVFIPTGLLLILCLLRATAYTMFIKTLHGVQSFKADEGVQFLKHVKGFI